MSQALQVAVWMTAILAASAGVGRLVIWLWRLMRKFSRLVDELLGTPATAWAPAEPGVLEQISLIRDSVRQTSEEVAGLRDRVLFIENQLKRNGGSSLRDVIEQRLPPTAIQPPDTGEAITT